MEHTDSIGEAELYVSVLRMVASRHGHTSEDDSLRWAVGQQYIELLPGRSADGDRMWAFTPKGLELVDAILGYGGKNIVLDGAGSFDVRGR